MRVAVVGRLVGEKFFRDRLQLLVRKGCASLCEPRTYGHDLVAMPLMGPRRLVLGPASALPTGRPARVAAGNAVAGVVFL